MRNHFDVKIVEIGLQKEERDLFDCFGIRQRMNLSKSRNGCLVLLKWNFVPLDHSLIAAIE